MNKTKIGFLSVVALASFSQAVMAEQALTKHFGDFDSCYARQYSQEHMVKNPNQTVSFVRVDHFPNMNEYANYDADKGMVAFNMTMRFKGLEKNYLATGECNPNDGSLKCGIECDGGGFMIKHKDDDSILIYNGGRMVLSGCDAGADYKELTMRTDDKIFLLHRLPASQCLSADYKK